MPVTAAKSMKTTANVPIPVSTFQLTVTCHKSVCAKSERFFHTFKLQMMQKHAIYMRQNNERHIKNIFSTFFTAKAMKSCN